MLSCYKFYLGHIIVLKLCEIPKKLKIFISIKTIWQKSNKKFTNLWSYKGYNFSLDSIRVRHYAIPFWWSFINSLAMRGFLLPRCVA